MFTKVEGPSKSMTLPSCSHAIGITTISTPENLSQKKGQNKKVFSIESEVIEYICISKFQKS